MRRSKPSDGIIHPRKLPFSEAEVHRAYRLCFSIRFAKELAREARDAVHAEHWDEVRAAAARAAGSTDSKLINSGAWLLQPGLPVLLALVSPEMHTRVREWRKSQFRSADNEAERDATWNETLRVALADLQRARAESREPSWVLFDLRHFQH